MLRSSPCSGVSFLQDEVVRFPYAILEVKVQQQPPPAWVQSMLLLADASTRMHVGINVKFSVSCSGDTFRERLHIWRRCLITLDAMELQSSIGSNLRILKPLFLL